jgi:hypothetical protein
VEFLLTELPSWLFFSAVGFVELIVSALLSL